jgi:hypothetical protein
VKRVAGRAVAELRLNLRQSLVLRQPAASSLTGPSRSQPAGTLSVEVRRCPQLSKPVAVMLRA